VLFVKFLQFVMCVHACTHTEALLVAMMSIVMLYIVRCNSCIMQISFTRAVQI